MNISSLKILLTTLSLAALPALATSCASSPSLTGFPERVIDRTPNLPLDASSWRAIYGNSWDNDPDSFFYPFYWEHGISERLTLVWMPLPFEVKYLLKDSGSSWLSAHAAFFGPVYSRSRKFSWRPDLGIQWRRKLSSDVAFDADSSFQLEIKRSDSPGKSWANRAGLLWQALPSLAVQASGVILFEQGEVVGRYSGAVPPENLEESARDPRLRFPIQFELSFAPSTQWELRALLEYDKLGYSRGYLGAPFYLSLIHYW